MPMRMIDYHCPGCGMDDEYLVRGDEDPRCNVCRKCGHALEVVVRPQRHYKPFEPYFDEGLGVMVTGKMHRRRVMRDLGMDFKDHMSKGDQTARIDKAMERRRELRQEGRARASWDRK